MVQKITKRSLLTGVIIILLMMTYSAVFCTYGYFINDIKSAVFETNKPTLWISYGFTMGVFSIAFITSVLAFERSDLRSRVFGIPVVLVGFGAICIQVVIDTVIMLVGAFVSFANYISIILIIFEVIFLFFVIVMIIVRQAYRGLIETIDSKEVRKSFTTNLLIEIETICKTNNASKLDKALSSLYDDVRYSDPVSLRDVEPIEDIILEKVEALKGDTSTGDVETALSTIDEIKILLAERKARLKQAKHK